MDNINEALRKIRNELRLSMNGVISTSMREKGMNYRMNFGVEIPRLKTIAKNHKTDKQLAEALWSQDVRELKILATLLYPVDEFLSETAHNWIKEIPNQEVREQLCMNLLQNLSYANQLVDEWVISNDESIRNTGYWLFARLIISRSPLAKNVNNMLVIEHALLDMLNSSVFLSQSALNALKFSGRISTENVEFIMHHIANFNTEDNLLKKEIFEQLSFEFDVI